MSNEPTTRTPSRWNGLSTEERQRERRNLLIEAAFELLANEGMSGTTVRAVCAHARLNPRYFYESFTDLDELLVAVYDDVFRQLKRRSADAVNAAEDDAAAMRASVAATVHFIAEDPRRGRILYSEALGNEALNLRRVRAGATLVELVLQDNSRRDVGAQDERIGRLGASVLVGGFSELLLAWIGGRLELTAEELIDDATEVFLAVWDATRRLHAAD
ncbi:TetR/AcrR family transcriptional regulator [Acidimicrobiia bacterium EGI L10123]|uniref:TetR/AcrR family transcriptional regulator n=1 Tax=Salinilacustrithrix flava TaxID=2957203 RepID=UPI003D7C1963|nr:TetR/AcrR family transcriptional regulator [Acidimicrobiia bacterium EGI L10123]